MSKKESFIKAFDEKDIHLTSWLPDSVPAGVLQMTHSFGEYAGRYDEWAERFTAEGFAVYMHDQRGHGETRGRRGAVKDYALLLDDVQAVRNHIEQEHPETGAHDGMPVVLHGHGMGGNVALNFLLTRQPERYVCSVITCPWLKLYNPPLPNFLAMLGRLSKVMPMFTVHLGLGRSILSHDARHIENTMAEKLCHNMIGSKVFLQIIEKGEYAISHAHELTTPVLLMQAGDDRFVSPDATHKLAGNAPELLDFRTYPNLYHELHNEIEREDIFSTTAEYLRDYVK